MYPVINPTHFKPKLVIDWIEVEVTLGRQTRFPYVQKKLHEALGIPQVEGHQIRVVAQGVKKPNDLTTTFWFRLHEHQHENSPQRLREALRALETFYGFTTPCRTIAIEPALDFWPANANALPGLSIAELLQLTIAHYGDNPRQYDPSTSKTLGLLEHPEPIPGATFYIGHHEARKGEPASDIAVRSYFKVTDRRDEEMAPISLPPNQHRARIEFTLRGAALEQFGLTDPTNLESANLNAMRKELFHFRKLLPPNQRLKKTSQRKDTIKSIQTALTNRKATGLPTPPQEISRLKFLSGLIGVIQGHLSREPQCHITSYPHGRFTYDPNKKEGGRWNKHSKHSIPHKELNAIAKKAFDEASKSLKKTIKSSDHKSRRNPL